ncbi:MAG: NTP transferase domain-containing protein [Gemmatimonadetes bacterium]|nr:NTP transferase domain-containing protein [Gemmatimonadota bacterium]NNM04132.1 NTP transferase domain-containing protein [Gemmatimonadota bacterium]
MKAVIPLAGKGTRLRPHTYLTPKPLLRVGGKPVMSYILDDLQELGVEEIVFVIGYLGDVVKEYMAEEYPDIRPEYVVQEVQDGTAGAVKLAEPFVQDEMLILFVDTLFDADLSITKGLAEEWAGVIWAKEVEDYQRFGVIVTDDDGAMTRIVEKPEEPISKLANIGLYHIRDRDLLFKGIDVALNSPPGPSGEFYLTDAFQYMVDQGSKILTAPVEGWYDCGKPETLLETNAHILKTTRGWISPSAVVDATVLGENTRIEDGVVLEGSTIGTNVTVEAGARIVNSSVRNSIIGPGAVIENSVLRNSLVGGHCTVQGFDGKLSVADHSLVRH